MVKNKFILVLFVFLLTACQEKEVKQEPLDPAKLEIISQSGETHVFDVEVAKTLEQQTKGLMYRDNLPEDAGMLFWFGDEQERGFWMKNTLISLDLIFIKLDGTIHRIHYRAKPHDLTPIRSYGPVAAVLEINGGVAEKLGLQKGDKINHAVFQLK